MVVIEDLLKEYERADMNKRLHMYLQFRDLRPMFSEKERGIIHQELGSHSGRQKAKRRAQEREDTSALDIPLNRPFDLRGESLSRSVFLWLLGFLGAGHRAQMSRHGPYGQSTENL